MSDSPSAASRAVGDHAADRCRADAGGREIPAQDSGPLPTYNLQTSRSLGESREPPRTAGPEPQDATATTPRPRQPRGASAQRLGHAAPEHQRDAAHAPKPTLQRQTALRSPDLGDLGLDDDGAMSRSSRLFGTSSSTQDWNVSYSMDSSAGAAALPAGRLLHRLLAVLPRVSDKVRRAGFVVQLQAFFKLSFEQFESDDTSFEELAEDARLTAAAELAHEQQEQQEQQQQQGGGGDGPAAIAAGSSGSGAGALARAAAEAAVGAVAAAFGSSAARGGRGLVVDIDMAPSAANCARLLLTSAIHPNSMFKVLWDFLYLPINMWICMVTPLLVVFVTNLRLTHVFGCVEFTIDVLCLLDVVVHLRTAVITRDFNVHTSRRRMARDYLLRRWGLLDLVACVPFLTLINIGPAYDFSRRVLLFRLLRLTKLLRMPNVLQTSNVQTYLSAKVFRQKGLVSLLVLLGGVLVTMHHAAAYFYFIGVVVTSNTMLTFPQLTDPDSGEVVPQSWVEAEDLANLYKFGRYIVALYWAMYTFLTVGYGDVAIVNTAEKIWAIITAITGVVMAGWFMGAVGNYMGGTGGAEAEMQQKRQDVFQFIQKRRLRGGLAARVQRYHGGLMWRQLSDEDRQVIDGLPRMLRTEVILFMYDKVVRKVSFMQTRPPQFVVELLLRLRLRLYDKGDYIVREGEIGGEIYFLAAGEVEVRRDLPPEGEDKDDGDGPLDLASSTARRRAGASRLWQLSRFVSAASKSFSHALGRTSYNGAGPEPAAGVGGGGGDGRSRWGSRLARVSRDGGGVSGKTAAAGVGDASLIGGKAGGGGGGGGGGGARGDVLSRLLAGAPPQRGRQGAAAAAATGAEPVPPSVTLGHIQAGGLFGHVSCMAGEARLNSVVAASSCEVLVLAKEDAEQLAKDWPDIYDDPAMSLDRGRRRSACLNDCLPAFVEHYQPLPGGPLKTKRGAGAAAAGARGLGWDSRRGRGAGGGATGGARRLSLGRVSEQRALSMREFGNAAAAADAGPFARASDRRTMSLQVRGSGDGGGGGCAAAAAVTAGQVAPALGLAIGCGPATSPAPGQREKADLMSGEEQRQAEEGRAVGQPPQPSKREEVQQQEAAAATGPAGPCGASGDAVEGLERGGAPETEREGLEGTSPPVQQSLTPQ